MKLSSLFIWFYLCDYIIPKINEDEYQIYKNQCENFKRECYDKTKVLIDKFQPIISSKSLSWEIIQTNKYVSNYYYYKGNYDYFGIMSEQPNLASGFINFVISSYLGNAKGQYKLYIILETNLIDLILNSKEYYTLLRNNEIYRNISNDEAFYNSITSKSMRKTAAVQFLYSSSLGKYVPSLIAIGYKHYYGIGMTKSCESSLMYYKLSASLSISELKVNETVISFDMIELSSIEYIKSFVDHKENPIYIQSLVDNVKKDLSNKDNIQYYPHIGERYLFGNKVEQNQTEALYWFQLGKKHNDFLSIYFLGLCYLHGWGVKEDHKKALHLLKEAERHNITMAKNALGYMYYYGLEVEKNTKTAFEYFNSSLYNDTSYNSYYNQMELLLESNNNISIDFYIAYKYGSYISYKQHPYGTYYFAIMNDFHFTRNNISPDLLNTFYRNLSKCNKYYKKRSQLAYDYYKKKQYFKSYLLYLELAEEGYNKAQQNAAILLKNHKFLKNHFYYEFNYIKYGYKRNYHYPTLIMGDYYYYGHKGMLRRDYAKAIKYYKKVINNQRPDNFYIAHAYYNIAYMAYMGYGVKQNLTKAELLFDKALFYEKKFKIPIQVTKIILLPSYHYYANFSKAIVENKKIILSIIISFALLYLFFYFSIKSKANETPD